MRKIVFLLFIVCSFASIGQAQTGTAAPTQLSMVDTERAFSRMSEEKGTRPAFMSFIAEDGILFRPNAVKGKQWMTEHPLPASYKRDLLSWAPEFAEVSSSDDMGYTFGPWQRKNTVNDEKPVAWGHFVTIWKKQADGSWRFAVDLGISHPAPPKTDLVLEAPKSQSQNTRLRADKLDSARAALASLERKFSEDSDNNGAQLAFLAYAAPTVRVFREGKFPFVGKEGAASAIPLANHLWTWEPQGWDVSLAGDLGYSYGTYWLKSNDANIKPETGNYFRIWKKYRDGWKVVVDVANPIPEKKN